MRADSMTPVISIGDFGNETYPVFNQPMLVNSGGGSQVVEPEIIVPVIGDDSNPVVDNNVSLGGIRTLTQQAGSSITNTGSATQSGTSAIKEPSSDSQPSPTTDQTKNYLGGGTSPDTSIIVKKPKPNYLMYGLVGAIGLVVVYRLFFNKK